MQKKKKVPMCSLINIHKMVYKINIHNMAQQVKALATKPADLKFHIQSPQGGRENQFWHVVI